MPEYLAPGVYVEETSFRAKSIQGVGTSTTAFVGPTRKGPLGMVSDVITSFGEFERIYGGLANLRIGTTDTPNYMAHAAKAFFDNGSGRLYVARTFTARQITTPSTRTIEANSASANVVDSGDATVASFRARSPGSGLNGFVLAYQKLTPATATTLNAAPTGSMVQSGGSNYFVKAADGVWNVEAPIGDGTDALDLGAVPADARLVTVNLEIRPGAGSADDDAEGGPIVIEGLGLGPGHPRRLADALPRNPTSRGAALAQPYWFDDDPDPTAHALRAALFGDDDEVRVPYQLTGGVDGDASVTSDADPQNLSYEEALALVEEVSDVAIVAAPGSSANSGAAAGTRLALISHAERMRYRIAVLDTQAGASVGDARDVRAAIDSKYAALYYPWVVVPNPSARPSDDTIPKELVLPPSGFICGIYARNDIQRGVWKAPANEVVRGALRFERELSKGEQEVLNPEGINCLRSFFGRGNRVWGARTISSDPEWIYVNVRRYFNYVENSIDRSTQWAVFEPNGPALWSNITDTISSFLFAEWRSGALLGATPEEAYFVRCDRSTMTQADLDNGRLICEIGIAAIKPAEFVIFRIGQKTADATS
ncbi:phage tail sheath subtilisin-like domain-containing protein [Erythrobacter sp. SDW2]|uniref:phage tail sheath subtilisin-like domain-containing protein n=1 Tax=Erythrobacter sp. SDW2 TaxID=2907154 RepID=UPI001F357A90|nr:phage tail sheath subtilisin-like domain-containing protein [Erythrobacter sp. SDW2]UIP07835.1 phage tail sheath subtilisin-like domain-containing protein [Erythrobacter sp. SDW2]